MPEVLPHVLVMPSLGHAHLKDSFVLNLCTHTGANCLSGHAMLIRAGADLLAKDISSNSNSVLLGLHGITLEQKLVAAQNVRAGAAH